MFYQWVYTINSMIISNEQYHNSPVFFPFSSSVKEDQSTIDNSICPYDLKLQKDIPIKFKWMIMEYLIQQKMLKSTKQCMKTLVQHTNKKTQFSFKRMDSFSKNAGQSMGGNAKQQANRKLSLFQLLTLQIENMKKDQTSNNKKPKFKKTSQFAATSPFACHKKNRTASKTLRNDDEDESNDMRPSICHFVKNDDKIEGVNDKRKSFLSTNNIYQSLINIIENKSTKKKNSRWVDDDQQSKSRKSKRSFTATPNDALSSASFKDSCMQSNFHSNSKISLLCIFSTLKSKMMNLQLCAFSELKFYQNHLFATPEEQKNYIKRSLDLLQENLQKDEQIMELHDELELKRTEIQAMEEQLNILKNSMKFNIFYKLEQLWKSHLIIGFNMIVSKDFQGESVKHIDHSSTKFDQISQIVIKTPLKNELKGKFKSKTLIYLDEPQINASNKIIDSDASIDYEGMSSYHNFVERDGFQQKSAVLSGSDAQND